MSEMTFEVRREKPEDFDDLFVDIGTKIEKNDLKLSGDTDRDKVMCTEIALCLRLASSDNLRYRNKANFVEEVKKYFEEHKNPNGLDLGYYVAYFFLGTTADFDDAWHRVYTDDEHHTLRNIADGLENVEIPQGEKGDPFGLGEVDKELVEYFKSYLIEHRKTTKDESDIKMFSDIVARTAEYEDGGVDSNSTFLKLSDLDDLRSCI